MSKKESQFVNRRRTHNSMA